MSPSLAREASKNNSKQMEFETLSLISNAADAISLGDVLDNSQRRYETLSKFSANNWSLLPVHAVFSTVIPCFYTHGQMNGMFNFPR
jgi:replication factor C subunit 1